MAPGGVIHAIQESFSAFRSFIAGRVHRSAGQFLSQSEPYNQRHDTDANGRWNAIASVTAFWERLFADSGWNAATAAAAFGKGNAVGCGRNATASVAARKVDVIGPAA